jgi:KUP system potassium uptake protein
MDKVIQAATKEGLRYDPSRTTFFLSRERIVATAEPGMALWQELRFCILPRNGAERNNDPNVAGTPN